MDPAYITSLAKLFRTNGEKILNGETKFVFTGQMLRALNDSFSLIIDTPANNASGATNESFVVYPDLVPDAKSSVFRDLQLIYDFIQTLPHLQICHLITDDDDMDNIVDLGNFRKLERLDIHKVPIRQFRGLRALRRFLQELTCQHCLRAPRDVLDNQCLANSTDTDSETTTAGHSLIWSELKVINFSNNALKRIDDSFRRTPWLQCLNLSYNRLSTKSVAPLKCLPHLKYLNLSYNRLTQVPRLAADASRSLLVLNVNNNYLDEITDVSQLQALTELDLSSNCLKTSMTLLPLAALASLRVLDVRDNALDFLPHSRAAIIAHLHSNTSTVKFLLNGQPMTRREKANTGGYMTYHAIRSSLSSYASSSLSGSVASTLNEVAGSVGGDIPAAPNSETSTNRRRLKVRHINTIRDSAQMDQQQSEADRNPLAAFESAASKDHLETKRRIEELRQRLGEGWLNSTEQNIVTEIYPVVNREEDLVRRRLLFDEVNDVRALSSTPKEFCMSTMVANINAIASAQKKEKNKAESEDSKSDDAEQSTLVADSNSGLDTTATAYESAVSQQLELDEYYASRAVSEPVESDPEIDEVQYDVEKLTDFRDESGVKLRLIVSDSSIREKGIAANETLNRWGFSLLESCERTKANVLTLQFDTMRKDKRERVYMMDSVKCQKLDQFLRDILARKSWSEFKQSVYRCANCTIQFCIEKSSLKMNAKVSCPECKSYYVIDITETAEKVRIAKPSSPPDRISESEVIVEKSNSHSSIGSATSLTETASFSKLSRPGSADSNKSVAGSSTSERDKDADLNARNLGMESDVEILSNPSQSSIEVLHRGSKESSRKHSEERFIGQQYNQTAITAPHRLLDEHSVGAEPAMEATAAILEPINGSHNNTNTATTTSTSNKNKAKDPLGHLFSNLTESSSSSGSITDSVCTAYERIVPVAVEEHKPIEVIAPPQLTPKEPENKGYRLLGGGLLSASNVLKSLTTTKVDGIKLKQTNPYHFSTKNFGQTDHRLQVYLYQSVFMEYNEKFNCVIRARFFDDAQKLNATTALQDTVFAMSNRKIYVLFVTSEEEDDDPQQWLKLMTRVDLRQLTLIRTLPFDMGVQFCFLNQTTDAWNLVTEDANHTGNLVQFLRKNYKGQIEEGMWSGHREKLMTLLTETNAEADADAGDEELLMLAPFKTLSKKANEVACVQQDGALLVTSAKFVVLSGNWKWLTEGGAQLPKKVLELAVKDMVECEINSATNFTLNFLDERQNQYEQWQLEFGTKASADMVLNAIKGPWEALFDAPLIQKQ